MPPTVQLMSNLLQPLHHFLPRPFRITELGEEKQREAFEARLVGVHSNAAGIFEDRVFRPGTEGDFVVSGVLLALESHIVVKRKTYTRRKWEIGRTSHGYF